MDKGKELSHFKNRNVHCADNKLKSKNQGLFADKLRNNYLKFRYIDQKIFK